MKIDLRPPDHVIVIFGANGDLSRRKLLPGLFHLHAEGLMPRNYLVVGNSRREMTDDEFKNFAEESLNEYGRRPPKGPEWDDFLTRLSYVSHDFIPDSTEPVERAVYEAEDKIGGEPQRLFYLSVPPPAFKTIAEGLGKTDLSQRAKVIFEKPFGRNLETFRELSLLVHDVLDESQVFRIDHFLGKETVQNILALRFANGMFEPAWNRHHIDHVQIDLSEEIGIGRRGPFYEGTGALRDMLVTHLLQVLAFVAMEPPTSFEPRPLADEARKLFESITPLDRDDTVRGQYEGYRKEPNVAPDSETETFVASRVMVDNWRWAGVPFYLRTGKRLKENRSSVTLAFREPPKQMFKEAPGAQFDQDHLTLELGPEEGISVTFLAKIPGPRVELAPASMVFRYEGSFGSEMIEAYERLIHDALIGDRTLFTRGDGIERTWELVEDVLDQPPSLHTYSAGSWGPEAADDLIAPRRWHLPH
ncbi:MAG: glucose-6-phosphate dehydrogenase [Actinomycetota bacterium]|nr:glucose-6-phosphate dehydrogenase [Actinomycetota bacterium]